MTYHYFDELMQGFGALAHGSRAYGLREGYPYSAELLRRGEASAFALRFAVNGSARAAAAALRAEKLPGAHWAAEPDRHGGVLVGIYTAQSDFYAKSGLHTLLAAAVRALAAQNLAPCGECPLCGFASCDAAAFLEDEWRFCHQRCLETKLDLPEQDHTWPSRTKGMLATGILGALAGAFIGALPIWTLALSQSKIYFALYAFIPILSGLMYRTARGKANRTLASLCVLAASLLWAFALEQVWYQLVLSAEYSTNLPFWLSLQTYFQSHTLALALREMWACLLALTVGFIAVTFFLRRYAEDGTQPPRTTHGAAYVRGTARPLKDVETTAPAPGEAAERSNETSQ